MMRFYVLLAVLLLSGCQLTASTTEVPLKERLQLQYFELQAINGQSLVEILGEEFDAKRRPSIEFQQDFLLAGRAGCNRFFGQGVLSGDRLLLKKGGATRMMCTPALMKLERSIQNTLNAGAEVSLLGDQLILKGETTELMYLKAYSEH